jgi:hypothetical protein
VSENEGEAQGQGFPEKPNGEEVGVERIRDLVREVLSEEARRDTVAGPVGLLPPKRRRNASLRRWRAPPP